MGSWRRWWWVAFLSIGGCGGIDAGFGVATTVIFDGTIDDATIARVTALEIVASGDERYNVALPLARRANRTERFLYRPTDTSRSLSLEVFALDDTAAVVAAGHSAVLGLTASQTTVSNITLDEAEVPDGGVDFATQADGGVDLGRQPSLCKNLTPADDAIACAGYEDAIDILNSDDLRNGTAGLDTARVYRGASAWKLSTGTGNAGTPKIAEQHESMLPARPMYALRAYVYMAGPPPQDTRVVDIQQAASPYNYVELGVSRSGFLYGDRNLGTYQGGPSTVKMPFGRWACLEMRVTVGNASTGQVHYFLDDKEIAELAVAANTTPASLPLSVAIFGQFFVAGDAAAFDMWLDEVVIAGAPIGCAK